MFKIVLLTTLLALASADTADLNKVVDDLLNSLRESLPYLIDIQDINYDWQQKWWIFKLEANFNCDCGIFRDLHSIERTGDCTLTTEGDKITLNVKLGLGFVEARYDHCSVSVQRMGLMSSSVDVLVGSNSVDAQISLQGVGSSCVVTLDHIALNHLGGIYVETDGGLFQVVESVILDVVVGTMRNEVTGLVNKALTKAVQKALDETNLCNLIPH